MIEPSKIREKFGKIEDENYKFRTYLKIHADPDELDEQFAELHKELFGQYDCSKCRNCCKEYTITFEETEIEPAVKKKKEKYSYLSRKSIKLSIKNNCLEKFNNIEVLNIGKKTCLSNVLRGAYVENIIGGSL